jgi:hypothetical protein
VFAWALTDAYLHELTGDTGNAEGR